MYRPTRRTGHDSRDSHASGHGRFRGPGILWRAGSGVPDRALEGHWRRGDDFDHQYRAGRLRGRPDHRAGGNLPDRSLGEGPDGVREVRGWRSDAHLRERQPAHLDPVVRRSPDDRNPQGDRGSHAGNNRGDAQPDVRTNEKSGYLRR